MLDYSDRVRTLRQRQLVHVYPQPATDFSALRVRAHHIPRSRVRLPKLFHRGHEEHVVGDTDTEPADGVKNVDTPRPAQVKRMISDSDDTDADAMVYGGTRISEQQRRKSTKLAAFSEQPTEMSIVEQLFSDDPDVGVHIGTSDEVCAVDMAEMKERNKCHKCTFIPVLQGTGVTPPTHGKGDINTDADSSATNTSFVDAAQIAEVNRKLREEAATRLLRAAVENLQRLENRPRDTLRVLATLRAQRRLLGRRRPSNLEAIPEVEHSSIAAEKTVGERPSIHMLSESTDKRVSLEHEAEDEVDQSAYNAFGSRGSVSETKKGKWNSSYSYDQSSRTSSSHFSFGPSKQEMVHFGSSGLFKTNRLQMHANRKFKQRNVKYKS